MKKLTLLALMCAALLGVACKKKTEVDTKPLQQSFQSAPAPQQSAADKVVSAVKAGDYAGATAQLQQLAMQANLTPDQQKAISDTLKQVGDALKAKGEAAAKDVQQSVDQLQKSLPGSK